MFVSWKIYSRVTSCENKIVGRIKNDKNKKFKTVKERNRLFFPVPSQNFKLHAVISIMQFFNFFSFAYQVIFITVNKNFCGTQPRIVV